MRLLPFAISALALTLPAAAQAQSVPATPAGKEALEILKEAVDVPTVAGRGNVPKLAEKLTARLVAGGFDPKDISFTPVEGTDTGYFMARYPGKDRAAKPVVINVHLDVVEARPEDWERDPFTALVENGYVFGRGSVDNKGDLSMIMATVLKLKRAGWVPSRDLVLGISGDEETLMRSTAKLAETLKNAELVLNGDGGGGELSSDFKPIVYSVQAAEKSYADFKLTVTDEGGHSSRPGSFNAIGAMSRALAKVDAYRFPAQLSPLTKAYWEGTAKAAPADVAAAMRAFAADPTDKAASDLLSSRSEYVGLVRTTCVPTMVNGGHAANALPQSVTANINCRIFPGTSRAQAGEILKQVIGDPRVTLEMMDDGSIESPESPLRKDVMDAVSKAVHERVPGLTIVPQMSAGASDSMYFRALGIPSYGVSAIFMRADDEFSHGLNERLPLDTIDPGVKQWETLLRTLLK
ncbi:M20/M25/M40 family metallo-hydrolase [Altererythrobacter sp. CC-YST694]|uniref:M20/M25/M40 family metallo-hydrolase n=1 Tax=Altererythrobacter sp. CC-YST694 TaxID=2755038 RepID=UPI001D023F13|nr:M20/M25/M40 family metallo-hydrolase [Altererythrobacter sp. CC-YST694]MCB5424037.1 M20/M25/M40 family metallo-hydrolase [Altererythrobacter sp. CC-YST694]